jgi:uncharacterized BrkB/YihY/UPF0761 family membrane protein
MRSAFAVIAGLVFTVVFTTFVDMLLHAAGVYPPQQQPLSHGLALLATAYRIPISIVGAWLTARMAPKNPMRHALILGAIGTVVGIAGVVVTWNMGLGPRWYPITLAVLALPQCWLGGKIFEQMVAPTSA